jgi:hypothetical protein
MLEAVGFPVAVNPETRLATLARKRGWLIERWDKAAGGPRPVIPMGDRTGAGARHRSTVATWTDRARQKVAQAMGIETP